ncbi:hypothetical protein [Tabrizicola thermarum]|uniref:hypothetical protein n=1 Tax=Tabrizicola thermarum TaxID=2670345 RepID=UPI000FFB6290|nr:hypothetical protein [Tabrizicola thermarum]
MKGADSGARKGNLPRENLAGLSAPDAVSVQAMDMGGGDTTTGLAGIHGREVGVHHVQGGKIVREEFFYSA